MFCKWCGKKITNNGKPCPSCGKMQDSLESGNGFWDLCSNLPVASANVPAEMPVGSDSNDCVKLNKDNNASPKNHPKQKKTAKLTLLLSAISISLILILIIEVGIGISKINKFGDQYSLLYSGHSDINATVNNRFDELMDYLATRDEENQSEQKEAPNEADSEVELDALLESNDTMFVSDTKIEVEVHEIESDAAKYLYIASGETLSDENVIAVWQKGIESADGNESWETVAVGTSYIVTSESDDAYYRFVRVSYSEYLAEYICYVTSVNPLSAVDGTEDEIETHTETGEDNETTPDATIPDGTEVSSDETLPSGAEVA